MQLTTNWEVNAEDSQNIDQLAELIAAECDVAVERKHSTPRSGYKDGGLTIGLAIVGLAFSGVSTLISVLAYWKSQKSKYSISIKQGDVVVGIETTSPDEIAEIVARLQQHPQLEDVEIELQRRVID